MVSSTLVVKSIMDVKEEPWTISIDLAEKERKY
jgi:hypothetical protein